MELLIDYSVELYQLFTGLNIFRVKSTQMFLQILLIVLLYIIVKVVKYASTVKKI